MGKDFKTIHLKIEGMTCGHCERKVYEMLLKIKGIEKADVVSKRGMAEIEFDPMENSVERIIEDFNANGIYKAMQ